MICSGAIASNSPLTGFEWDQAENVGSLTPLLLSLVNRRQVLSDGGDLLFEGDHSRLDTLECIVRDVWWNFVRKFGELSANFSENLSGDDQTHLIIDDYNLKIKDKEQWIKDATYWLQWRFSGIRFDLGLSMLESDPATFGSGLLAPCVRQWIRSSLRVVDVATVDPFREVLDF